MLTWGMWVNYAYYIKPYVISTVNCTVDLRWFRLDLRWWKWDFKRIAVDSSYFEGKTNSGVKMVRSAEEDLSLEPDILEESKKKGNGV